MQDIDKPEKRYRIFYPYIVLIAVVCIALCLYTFTKLDQGGITTLNAEELEALLTSEHGNEAREAIEHFEQTWMSLEMHKDMQPYYAELLTGPLLRSYLDRSDIQDNDYWLIHDQTDVDNLRVVDYSDQKMLVVACISQEINEVDHNGCVVKRYPLNRMINLYVFIRDGGSWKVGNVIEITDPKQALQDWDFMSQDLKDVSGEINSYVYKNCITENIEGEKN